MDFRIILIIILLSCSIGLYGQYPAELIEYNTEISLRRNKLETKVTKLLQINNSTADHLTDTYIHFSKGDDLKIQAVRIEDTQGNILRELKKKEFKTQSSVMSGALYTDDFVKYFKPKWHQYPYRIYYEYTRTVENYLSIARWSPITDSKVPTASAKLSISLPKDFPVTIDYPNVISFSETDAADEKIYSWTANNMLPPKLENSGPPLQSILPAVFVFPEAFEYGLKGRQKTWQEYGQWQYQMFEEQKNNNWGYSRSL